MQPDAQALDQVAGRSVHCQLAPRSLEEAAAWLSRYQQFWTAHSGPGAARTR